LTDVTADRIGDGWDRADPIGHAKPSWGRPQVEARSVSDQRERGAQRVSGIIVRALASYLRRALGAEELEALLDQVGISVDPDDEALDMSWYYSRDLAQLVALAEDRCGDPELGRRVGEELFRFRPDLLAFYHGAGSVRDALRVVINLGSRTRTQPAFVVVDEGPHHIVVHATAAKSSRFTCGVSAGNWALVPTLFGTTGTVVEPTCVTRGDARCEFRISWGDDADESVEAVERSRTRGNTLVSRFEELQSLAAELAAESTTEGLLQKIAERAKSAVLAPSAVVAVRMGDAEPLSLGWSGIDEFAANELAATIDQGDTFDDPSIGVVPLESPRRRYGHLAVMAQSGSRLSDNEMRMLTAYAGHATAAIEAAAALEEAQVERDTAEALLDLARVLARVGSTAQIAQRIAEAVPNVVKCDLSAVMLWEPTARTLSFVGSWPHPVDALGFDTVKVDDIPLLAQITADLAPRFTTTAETEGMLRTLLMVAGAECASAAPISIRGEFIGLVIAATTDESATVDSGMVLHRLSGLADHAATALDNSRLLERVRHQALHDPLTGLANRTLIEDRVEHALTVAERVDRWVTLLFVDLDRFKAVNDELGHAAGDALLTRLAQRLISCVRASDTVGRLGGDEFLILLENTSGDEDGARVADKIIEALRDPFEIGDTTATVSVSIGITSAPGRGTTYDELLARADQAMYEVKHQGRDGWSVFTPSLPGLDGQR
jgi:diguanylate cyclase (GGDEF)-like protein